MMMRSDNELRLRLTAQFVEIYGEADGVKYAGVVIPAVLADFDKVLAKAPVGERVREEYRVEDGRARVILEAVKGRGESRITARAERMD